jgi:hypothetical protein
MIPFTIPEERNIRESESKILFNFKMRFDKVSCLNFILQKFPVGN